jgi:branched-chain amino acid aminotransferase
MTIFASIDGSIQPAEQARISVLDNGFTFGDSVYETLRTYDGRPLLLGPHLTRLRASAGRLGIEIPVDDAELRRRLRALLDRAGHAQSFIRMIVTRGVGDISYNFGRVKGPTIVMVVKPFEAYAESQYTEGITLIVSAVRRNHPLALDPAIKSCNLLNNIFAVREAQARGAQEAILLNERGEVAECASSNLFVVRGAHVSTPPLSAGILAGITRAAVIDCAGAIGIETDESPISVDALLGADEVFITSSLKEVVPVKKIDDRPIGTGKPGSVTQRILAAFREAIPRLCD